MQVKSVLDLFSLMYNLNSFSLPTLTMLLPPPIPFPILICLFFFFFEAITIAYSDWHCGLFNISFLNPYSNSAWSA